MDIQLQTARRALERLVPSVEVHASVVNQRQLEARVPHARHRAKARAGEVVGSESAAIWFMYVGRIHLLELSRQIPLSSAERRFLKHFSRGIVGLIDDTAVPANRTAQRIAAREALEHLVVTRFIRKGRNATNFFMPSQVLHLLSELTLKRYEGSACTSGFVYVSDLDDFKGHISRGGVYAVDEFKDEELSPTLEFFDSPASYRYVDGKNAFYVADNQGRIAGVVRLLDPATFPRSFRAVNAHLIPLLTAPGSRGWVGRAGDRLEVDVVVAESVLLRRTAGHWQFIDLAILRNLIKIAGCNEAVTGAIVRLLLLCAEIGKGTVILIPEKDQRFPRSVGRIDESALGRDLSRLVRGETVEDAERKGIAVGLLTSDGLTTISSSGRIVRAGDIIDTSSAKGHGEVGGGRTQAAVAASDYGLAIKVSEDGPLSVYSRGELLLRFQL